MFELNHGSVCIIKRCGKPHCSAHPARGLESTRIVPLYHGDLFGNVSFELSKRLQFHIEIKALQTRLSRLFLWASACGCSVEWASVILVKSQTEPCGWWGCLLWAVLGSKLWDRLSWPSPVADSSPFYSFMHSELALSTIITCWCVYVTIYVYVNIFRLLACALQKHSVSITMLGVFHQNKHKQKTNTKQKTFNPLIL